jgi:3-oxoacyl-[acyl-carrier-protein] synthase-3
MTGINAVASYIPPCYVDNLVRGKSFGESEDFIRGKIGALKLPQKSATQETSDLAALAVERLIGKSALKPEQIQVLVVVTQNGDGCGLPHTSAIVQRKLGLSNDLAAFDVSLGCSGYVYGLMILTSFMEGSGLEQGVLVTADPYSKVINQRDRITSLLFGDAATASWIGKDPAWTIGKPLYWTDGNGADYLCVRDRTLEMNGRQIFNFAALKVPEQIKKLLEQEGLQEEDIDIYCLHQGSAAMVEVVAKSFPKVRDRFILNMIATGNTVSSSIPLLLEDVLCRPDIQRVLISGFGVGLSLSTTIIQKRR